MVGRRMGPKDAAVRIDLLDATERVLGRDGYPSVTSRNVGKEAGVNQKLVFYYFENMEELIVATFRRRSVAFLSELENLKDSASPLASLWAMSSHRSGRLLIEFMSMALRNAALQQEVENYTAQANRIINAAIGSYFSSVGAGIDVGMPAFINFAISSMARNLILESELGLIEFQEELTASIERWIGQLSVRRDDDGPMSPA